MAPPSDADRFWRLEDNLQDLGSFWPHAYLTRNAHRLSARILRLSGLVLLAIPRLALLPFAPRLSERVFSWILRTMSEDRIDVMGEEYFRRFLRPRVDSNLRAGKIPQPDPSLVLVSNALAPFVRPIAAHLGFERFVANELDFRDGAATGRIRSPLVAPRRFAGRLAFASRTGASGGGLDAGLDSGEMARDLGMSVEDLRRRIEPVRRSPAAPGSPVVVLPRAAAPERFSVVRSLAGKQILLIGSTGFIGKVWLAKLLTDVPDIGRIHLLIRPQRNAGALRRFEQIVEESPVLGPLHERLREKLPAYLGERVRVIEGDASRDDLGLPAESLADLRARLDLVVNSSGLTDFNPDLRQALAANVEATARVVEFVRRCDHAALLHLSTCYVVGNRDGRILEEVRPDYVPSGQADFDAQREIQSLYRLVREAEEQNGQGESRLRRLMSEIGMRRAQELGWPNTYTLTKSLGESLIVRSGAGLPIAIVRPSIVETSLREPFVGWNEGINTSTPISYLLGTTFRQLPANERKCLDIVPVDLISRGMTLVAAALVGRCHASVYQLATSVTNPCDMRRSIELTSLAHRIHYREQRGFLSWWKARADAIPVSKIRYMRLSAPSYQALQRAIRRLFHPLSSRWGFLTRFERATNRVAKLIEIYEPFILHNDHVFEARNVELLSSSLPPEERERFGYDATSIDWKAYWIDLHIPAMRRWCYPLLEGKTVGTAPRRPFRLPDLPGADALKGVAGAEGGGVGREASWRSS